MVKIINLSPVMDSNAIKEMEGEFFDLDHYHTVIDEDCDAYIKCGKKNKLLFKFRTDIIPKELANIPVESFSKDLLRKKTNLRGIASGKVQKDLVSKNVKGFVNPNSFKSKLIFKDGTVSSYYRSNNVHSMIAGYFDKPRVQDKTDVTRNGKIPCRLTVFSSKNRDKWGDVLPLIQYVNEAYKHLLPQIYKYQKTYCDKVPNYCIDNTIFSTLTVNYNWRTACHVDKGDLINGYSAITVAEEGEWEGCFLGYPQYGVCINVREGDLLLKDPHQYHCNTKFVKKSPDAKRITMVYYFREGMLECMTKNKNTNKKINKNTNTNKKINKNTNTNKKINKNTNKKINKNTNKKINKNTNTNMSGGGKNMDLKIVESKPIEMVNGMKNPLKFYIRPDTTDIKVIDEVINRNVYQKKKIGFLIEPDSVWLDLGANIGTFTLFVLSKGGNVYAYEPEPENFELLRDNIKLNKNIVDINNVEIFQQGVAMQSGKTDLYICKGEYNKYRHSVIPIRGREKITINVVSLLKILKSYPDIMGIKMDIEGAEIEILEKMTKWPRNITHLVFEYSFDVDPSIPRFLKIIEKLEKQFKIVHYTKVKKTDKLYTYFPKATNVFCIR